eukprot:TRINITY_DN15185_c0_g1::TRINITY_DN15185_c0_g1_i1::g.30677::m.30677 TRINITY_DN15185_c0_g1::TRINITY_DN15185_c0_g1_i1::g.30677  ORF type:complete len:203 (+),score=28.73,sp/Q556Y9/MD2L1_DICDI/62.89/3e-86,HORMA/PF02301.13/1.1e-42 TRINITY_DN15185_c0_g1_i1:47-655(+)
MTSTETRTNITLRGSTEIVTEFFGYGINNILFQRGIYPSETFKPIQKYGLSLYVTSDPGLNKYLQSVFAQLSDWLLQKTVQRLVLVITSVATQEVLERWVFDIEADKEVTLEGPGKERSEKDVMNEIQAIMRQITASVSFLPLLEEPCTFDLLVYTHADCEVPQLWEESDPKYITNAEEVRLRSFTTRVHKVDAMVSFKSAE